MEISEAIGIIENEIGETKWTAIARDLGLRDATVDQLKHDYRHEGLREIVHQMFVCWQKKQGSLATLQNLASTLMKNDLKSLADLICPNFSTDFFEYVPSLTTMGNETVAQLHGLHKFFMQYASHCFHQIGPMFKQVIEDLEKITTQNFETKIDVSQQKEEIGNLGQMTSLTQGEVIPNIMSMMQILEDLKKKQNSILLSAMVANEKSVDSTIMDERTRTIKKMLEKIEMGLGDAQFIIEFNTHLEVLEGNTHKLRTQVRRLRNENSWLREELEHTQLKFQASELQVVQLEEDNKHLGFLCSLKKYDLDRSNETTAVEKSSEKLDEELCYSSNDSVEQEGSEAIIKSEQSNMEYAIPTRLRTINDLIIEYKLQKRFEIALPLCLQALDDLEIACGRDHPDFASMLHMLAMINKDQKKYQEAEKLLNDVLAIREKTLGKNHPAVFSTLNNLAIICGKQGKYKDAESFFKRVLENKEMLLGQNHPDVAKQLSNIAFICHNQEKYEEGEAYYRRALEIYESKLGPNDPDITKVKNNLAFLYQKQGKLQEAEIIYKQVLTQVHEKKFGSINGDNKPIWQVAEEREENVGHETDNYKERHDITNFDSPTLTKTLQNLADLYRQQGKLKAAETLDDCLPTARKKVSDIEKQAKVTCSRIHSKQ